MGCTLSLPGTSSAAPSNTETNHLPPPFLFVLSTLLRLQNAIQALVIVAALLTLIPTRKLSHKRAVSSEIEDGFPGERRSFTSRIWSLLSIEVNEEEGSGDIKLINLADEVVREYHLMVDASPRSSDTSNPSKSEEGRLRNAVDRILKPNDPVYILLHKRLVSSIAPFAQTSLDSLDKDAVSFQAPLKMRSGIIKPDRKKARVITSSYIGVEGESSLVKAASVKGFEEPFLAEKVSEVLNSLIKTLRWVQEVWGDVITR